jgi:nitric oxide reductase subunit B
MPSTSPATTDASTAESPTARRPPLISRWWAQTAILVLLFGFTILGMLAVRVYQGAPPIPERVVSSSGETLFTAEDIHDGQRVFLENGLMQYGTILGHGAYLGEDFTADYLHRAAQLVLTENGGPDAADALERTRREFKANTYDAQSGTLTITAAQAAAFDELVTYYAAYFGNPDPDNALRPEAITDPAEIRRLTAFFQWTAWAGSTLRPDKDYTYTNNWPPEELVGNEPSAPALVWSAISLVGLIGGIGALMAVFGRWSGQLGWVRSTEEDEEPRIADPRFGDEQAPILSSDGLLRLRRPDRVALSPSQRSTVFYLFVVALLFLFQTLAGGLAEHFRADPSGFFGWRIQDLIPFNLARTWHVQLAIFWVAAAFLAAGLFLAPMISGREPKRQHVLTYVLLGAVAVVVFGSLGGELLGIHGRLDGLFGNQGFEYLDLGRFWQVLLTLGLFIWAAVVFRGLRRRLMTQRQVNLPWLFFFAALAIPAVYAVGLLARAGSTYTVNDFWRFWVVHLWVEQFLELFTTVMVAYVFVLLGITSQRLALRLVLLDVIIYSVGGVIGTMHHAYFSGEPAEFMAFGAVFSALEVVPLTFLTVEAWRFLRLSRDRFDNGGTPFLHHWAVMFFVAVGFWNFVGAGVFGFLINLPIVSYYEIGTALTPNHGHAAFFGVYGMLAIGLSLFCLRYLVPERSWSDKAARICFWSTNIGLAWMIVVTLFPVGVLQLYESVANGYWAARSPEFLAEHGIDTLEWLRLPGDLLIILGGTLPLLWLCWQGVRGFRAKAAATGELTAQLYETDAPDADGSIADDQRDATADVVGAG